MCHWWAFPFLRTKVTTRPRAVVLGQCPFPPVLFSDECFRPPPALVDFIFFCANEEEDSSLSSPMWMGRKPTDTCAYPPSRRQSPRIYALLLHVMALLQVFQAKLLQSMDRGNVTTEALKDQCTAMDFTLMATKRRPLVDP